MYLFIYLNHSRTVYFLGFLHKHFCYIKRNWLCNYSDTHLILIHLIFLHYRDLIRLNLGRNKLKEIPYKALDKLSYLQILEMSDNQITSIKPEGFKGKMYHIKPIL